jgi:hypothetical protein
VCDKGSQRPYLLSNNRIPRPDFIGTQNDSGQERPHDAKEQHMNGYNLEERSSDPLLD